MGQQHGTEQCRGNGRETEAYGDRPGGMFAEQAKLEEIIGQVHDGGSSHRHFQGEKQCEDRHQQCTQPKTGKERQSRYDERR